MPGVSARCIRAHSGRSALAVVRSSVPARPPHAVGSMCRCGDGALHTRHRHRTDTCAQLHARACNAVAESPAFQRMRLCGDGMCTRRADVVLHSTTCAKVQEPPRSLQNNSRRHAQKRPGETADRPPADAHVRVAHPQHQQAGVVASATYACACAGGGGRGLCSTAAHVCSIHCCGAAPHSPRPRQAPCWMMGLALPRRLSSRKGRVPAPWLAVMSPSAYSAPPSL